MPATLCSCPWEIVHVHPDVAALFLRGGSEPSCRIHREELLAPTNND